LALDDLIERARAGDREAFGTLAAAAVDRLYSVAVRVLSNREDAEDAVQSALVDAWRDLPKLRDPQRFDAWLYRLLIRSCYEHAGRRRRFSAQVRELHLEPAGADSSAALADRDEIDRAFRRLPLEQRAVVVLHHYRSLSLKETADVLGIAEGTARSRFHYALKTLRAAIEADARIAVPEGELA
jgi:RNA polymerase sigma-70 factor (ECF subfamily)